MTFFLGVLCAMVYFHAGLIYELRMEVNNQTFHLPGMQLLVRIADYAGMIQFSECLFVNHNSALPDDCVCGGQWDTLPSPVPDAPPAVVTPQQVYTTTAPELNENNSFSSVPSAVPLVPTEVPTVVPDYTDPALIDTASDPRYLDPLNMDEEAAVVGPVLVDIASDPRYLDPLVMVEEAAVQLGDMDTDYGSGETRQTEDNATIAFVTVVEETTAAVSLLPTTVSSVYKPVQYSRVYGVLGGCGESCDRGH